MAVKSKRKTTFTYAELLKRRSKNKDDAVQKAREWLQEGQFDHDWFEYVYEQWKSALEQIGFNNPDIKFTGFWSQGDGASFTANVDLPTLIDFLASPVEPKNSIDVIPGTGKEDFRPWLVEQVNGVAFDPKFAKIHRFIESVELDGPKRTSHSYYHEGTTRFESNLNDRGDFDGPIGRRTWKSKTPRIAKLWDDFVKVAEDFRYDLNRAIYKSLEQEHDYLESDEALIDVAEANDYKFDRDGKWVR